MKKFTAVDLFCGGGGTSTGLRQACERMNMNLDLTAVNHWDVAISTHTKNHPDARHICGPIDAIKPQEAIPGGYLNLLVASPECTHHSNARGGKPMSDQSRATPWDVCNWLEKLTVDNVIIENVREFQSWGPLNKQGRPIKSKKGMTFDAFINTLRSLNYRVEYQVLNAADYGAATSRERLFIIARRNGRKIIWPEKTHAERGNLYGGQQQWRSAREIIDWSIPGKSIFGRRKPLARATLKRIEIGLRKFGGELAEPFIVTLRRHATASSIHEPIGTISTSGAHHVLVQPITICIDHGSGNGTPRSVDQPLQTVTTKERVALVTPAFIVPPYGNSNPSVEDPLNTIATTSGTGFGLCTPYIIPVCHGIQDLSAWSIDDPLRTVTTKEQFALIQPDEVRFDILFRMLYKHELAAAQGFPKGYIFDGTAKDQVKQIGNAVEVNMARALSLPIVSEYAYRKAAR